MPPTAKDLDMNNAQTHGSASTGSPSADAGKPQPVALEVPVTVNGARTVEGSDKREPFSESTQTVLVFGNGAVIRLASAVTAGQLLFLTNDKTKKEVVCQVVKSKNYRNVSGYVELEFTEAVSGFWGVRFPAAQPNASASAPAAAKPPIAPAVAAPRVEAPAASSLPKRPESQPVPAPPVRTETVTTSALKTEVKPPLNLPRAADPKPATTQPPAVPTPFSSFTSSSRPPEVKPPAPVATKVPPAPLATVNTQASTDALKRESARLQEQLSTMIFNQQTPAKSALPATTQPAANKPASTDSMHKVIEMAKPQAPSVKAAPPAKSTSSLDSEEVKIPSWLEPLARNAATPAHNEIPTRDEAAHADQVIEFEVQDVSAPAITQETAIVAPAETAPDIALPTESVSGERASTKSNKGILIGAIAAGLLLAVAGGTWYARQGSTPAQPSAVAAAIPAATNSAPVAQPAAKKAVEAPAPASTNSSVNSASAPAETLPPTTSSQANSQPSTPTAQPLKNSLERSAAAELSAYKKLAEPRPEPPVQSQPQPKKPSIGEVHFAAPTVTRRAATPDATATELAPALNAGQVASGGDALGEGLAGGSVKQPVAPAAPLPIGGDVKQAHLISSVPPVYPAIAKTQHIQGNVQIDALVDANGRVSSMKIVSGPVLLHQSAMEALRQWKYQPATLDGKPVAMHLAVTVQFRLQ